MISETEYITGLMRDNYDALGFIPATTVEHRYIKNHQYIMQYDLKGRRVGYLLHGKPAMGGVLTIAQAVIDFDLRDAGHGHDVVSALILRANTKNCSAIKLRCADNLTANIFWQHMQFVKTNTVHPENTRKRAINIYVKYLWPTLFY